MRFKKTSRFEYAFTPEKFDDITEKLDPYYLATRPVTVPFNYKQYKICFKKEIKKGILKEAYEKLDSYLK